LAAYLADMPGATDRAMRSGMSPEQERALHQAIQRLIFERRIACVRWTSNAPILRTNFFYFSTGHGRLEVVADDGISFAFEHDPLGTYRDAMEAALREDAD
jgi:hypothetical protein